MDINVLAKVPEQWREAFESFVDYGNAYNDDFIEFLKSSPTCLELLELTLLSTRGEAKGVGQLLKIYKQSLRDQFAMAALTSPICNSDRDPDYNADWAYRQADAMMSKRKET